MGRRAGAGRVDAVTRPDPRDPVCVIGGGLAGIAAAVRLADAGARVTLLEARPELGGATYSFWRDGRLIDTGQHVFLRCFQAYRRLLERLGSTGGTVLQDRFAVPVVVPGRPAWWLIRSRLPAPAHLLPALAGYRLLRPAERLSAIRTAAALRTVDPDDPATDAHSFQDWLRRHGQSTRAIQRLWDLIAVSALNVSTAQASLALAARVFRTGLLTDQAAGDLGRPLAPLRELHGTAARGLLSRLGVRVHTRSPVRWLRAEAGGFRLGGDGAELAARAAILAVPHRVASRLVPPDVDGTGWWRLGSAPIVNVHLCYAGRVTDLPFAAAVDSPAQWIFDRSGPGPEQHLVVSLSAADTLIRRRSAELVATQQSALAALFPAAASTPLREAFVTREPHATFRQAPGTRAWRPAAATALPGLALAGAWTDTGWPDTMEGAVRSGDSAAEVILTHLAARPRTSLEAAR